VLRRIAPPVDSPVEGAAHFELDIREAVLTFVDETETHLVIQSWIEGRGFSELRRT
jgi:hypothetical protein